MQVGTHSNGKKIFSVKVIALSAIMAKAYAHRNCNADEILFCDAVGTQVPEGLQFNVELTTLDNTEPVVSPVKKK